MTVLVKKKQPHGWIVVDQLSVDEAFEDFIQESLDFLHLLLLFSILISCVFLIH